MILSMFFAPTGHFKIFNCKSLSLVNLRGMNFFPEVNQRGMKFFITKIRGMKKLRTPGKNAPGGECPR